MGKLVAPKVYWVGETRLVEKGLMDFLRDSGNLEFCQFIDDARADGLEDGAILMSMFAKLCYASLTLGHNANLTRVRSIEDNIKSVFDTAHGSILEHVLFNFVIDKCSRVFTHELVRHRAGTAFSQTSGRYCRLDEIDLVFDPILDPVKEEVQGLVKHIEEVYAKMVVKLGLNTEPNFDRKKLLTSALRRVAPNGQSNQMGFSLNLRTLRHTIMLRTARTSEWEIRNIYAQIYRIMKAKYPLFFHGAKEGFVNGEVEVTGMKIQPWEKDQSLSNYTLEELKGYIAQAELAS
jgi:thymidylate synthase (FAD)